MRRRGFLGGLASVGLLATEKDALAQDALAEPRTEQWWRERHLKILDLVSQRPNPRIVLLGDSITQNYDKALPPDENFQPTWQRFFAPRRSVNLGMSGDTTSNLLWRIQNGEVNGLAPEVCILLIGTNDTASAGRGFTKTIQGIDAVVAELERRLPSSHILLLGILPSNVSDQKTAVDREVNEYLAATYELNDRVTYLDIGSVFMKDDGGLNESLFYDLRLKPPRPALHPDTKGQELMAQAIEPILSKILKEPPIMPLHLMKEVDTTQIPVPRLEIDSYDWYARHQAVKFTARKIAPKIVLIGDSITHFWGGVPTAARASGSESWDRLFKSKRALNMGFGWDRIQNVLWRLRQGELDGVSPDWVIVNIGTNNLTATSNARANTPEEISNGVSAIVANVRLRSPKTKILVMGIFPRGLSAEDALRPLIRRCNALIAHRVKSLPYVQFLDIGPEFLDLNGNTKQELLPDGTHPSAAGYELWAQAIAKII